MEKNGEEATMWPEKISWKAPKIIDQTFFVYFFWSRWSQNDKKFRVDIYECRKSFINIDRVNPKSLKAQKVNKI